MGVVLQAYLKRTQRDAEQLAATKANVRMCKGIYVESPRIAYKDADQIRASFLDATRTLLSAGSYVGIATHDEILIDESEKIVSELGLTRDQYEFQMLLGVNEPLRERIRDTGHRLRVYVPYGEQWYAYSLRRLKENPSIAGHILRATLGFGPERNGRGS